MSDALNLIGQRFGKLTVIKRVENTKKGNTQWLCQCDCGNTKIALGYDLTHNRTVSCGCNPKGKISPRRVDITGKRYGKLTVISLNEEKSKNGKLVWDCICDCGNTLSVSGGNLKSGHTLSCGFLNEHASNFKDITGQRFGRLVALEPVKGTKKPLKWLCQCDCGNTTIVAGGNLRSGTTCSCGCYKNEKATERLKNAPQPITRNKSHGMSNTRLYREFNSMKMRCSKNYHGRKSYYDKGITICEEWHKFDSFKEWALKNGYNDSLTLDRKDNNKGYSSDNCRWVDMKTQENNRSDNVFITRDGRTQTLKQWCEEYNLDYGMVKARRRKGWSEERLFEPKHKNQYQ